MPEFQKSLTTTAIKIVDFSMSPRKKSRLAAAKSNSDIPQITISKHEPAYEKTNRFYHQSTSAP